MPTARSETQTPPPAPQGSQNPKRGHEQRPIPAPAFSSEVLAQPKPTQGSSRCFCFLSPLEARSVSSLLSRKGAPSSDAGSPAPCQAGRTCCPGSAGWLGGELVPRPIINSSQPHNSSQMAPGSWGLDHLLPALQSQNNSAPINRAVGAGSNPSTAPGRG